jgi:hypothetical protein
MAAGANKVIPNDTDEGGFVNLGGDPNVCFRARNGPQAMSAIPSLTGINRTWNGHLFSVAFDPTRTSGSFSVSSQMRTPGVIESDAKRPR